MAARKAYENWDINAATATVTTLAEDLKELYKNEVGFPAEGYEQVNKGFAPSRLFWRQDDLYYSNPVEFESAYIGRFVEFDPRAPYRGNYKRTEIGMMFPELIEDHTGPKPGEKLTTPRQYPVPIWQDETAPISDWRARNLVDWHTLDFAVNFLDYDSYNAIQDAILGTLRYSNSLMLKLMVDSFIVGLLGNYCYSYPSGHMLHRFFAANNEMVPDQDFSKLANAFFKSTGEFKKKMDEIIKYTRKYYIARDSYLTNIVSHEILGQNIDKTVPKWKEKLVDRSDANKMLAAVRDWFLEAGADNKYTKVGFQFRKMSLTALSAAIIGTVKRMLSPDVRNWCGHNFVTENKAQEGLCLAVRPENLIVLMNDQDMEEMQVFSGSELTAVITDEKPIGEAFRGWAQKGVSFYGVNYILPSMAVVLDQRAFKAVQYFDEQYEQFFPYDLVKSIIHHLYVKPCLYRKVACNVLELAKGQKYACPIKWASEHLPKIRSQD